MKNKDDNNNFLSVYAKYYFELRTRKRNKTLCDMIERMGNCNEIDLKGQTFVGGIEKHKLVLCY